MKRLLLILLTIPLLAAGPEPEWKVMRGEWEQKSPTCFRSNFGVFRCENVGDGEEWHITMNITVLAWKDGSRGLAGIAWGPNEKTIGLFLHPDSIRLVPQTGNPCAPVIVAWSVPAKRRIGITVQITPTSLNAVVGGKRIKAEISTNTENLRFTVNGADAIFDAISVK